MSALLSLLSTDLNRVTVPYYQECFKELELTHSFPRKQLYIEKVQKFADIINFPWRQDQRDVIDEFLRFSYNTYVVHAVFGSGKTTLLMGLLIQGILNKLFMPSEVMFVSFNISIKNEILRKLTYYGIVNKVAVRTFDSIIYEICKHTGYEHMDLPNFDGKRKHVYNLIYDLTCDFNFSYQPSIIFIDECQDLEKTTMEVMRRFFPNSRFVLAGDIFQSIQKEPRESVLWHYVHTDIPDVFKIYMSETPRVPEKNLKTLQKALSSYYPEFKDKIDAWHSSNKSSDADVEWRTLDTYSQIFEELEDFCNEHKAEETMILTFSSAITVNGTMGDVARLRRFLSQNDINVNKNHKRQIENEYFLTTANSSKGLERDYVIVFLTFPLERAFINLSDDIVVNLITVALTRAKKKVIMYVPTYTDKFSRVLHLFDACPKPREKKIREDKTLTEFKEADFLNLEHTVTELIRQSVIKYDTRIALKENVKVFDISTVFDNNIPLGMKLETEEEKAFVGTLIENLITSTWNDRWPAVSDYHTENNPMYNHCTTTIARLKKKYNKYITKNLLSLNDQFDGIFCYSQIHIAISNKLMFHMPEAGRNILKAYWQKLRPKVRTIRPREGDIKIQSNLKMPLLKGVADAVITKKNENEQKKSEEITIIEIKASSDREWKDDALTQAILYSLMTGKLWSRLILLNPFMNQKVSYYFNSKNILSLRNLVFQDIMTFNINCLLAKQHNVLSQKPELRVEDCFFVNVNKDDNGDIEQVSVIHMLSPIKTEVLYNQYIHYEYEDGVKLCRKEKLCVESNTTMEKMIEDVKTIVANPLYNQTNKTVIYSNENIPFLDDVCVFDVDMTIEEEVIDDSGNSSKIKNFGEYDSLCKNVLFISRVFGKFKFY